MTVNVQQTLAALLVVAYSALCQPAVAQAGREVKPTDHPALNVKPPVSVIFDTDMYSDIDDMLALAMLHALQQRHEIRLLAVTITTEEPWCASYVDLVNTFYGHPETPIGMVRGGVTGQETIKKVEDRSATPLLQRIAYVQALSQRRNLDGSPAYPHRLLDGAKATDATVLLRKSLATQPDASVVIIQVGFSTNLARLMDSAPDAWSALPGRELVKKKVRLLSVMAGNFAAAASGSGPPEFNLLMDVASAQHLFDLWPTPVVFSGFEIGLDMLFPAKSIADDFTYTRNHPIAESYRYYVNGDTKWPHDHPTFDLTSVLYAVRPDRGYFALSKPGKVTVLADGGSQFEETPGGLHRYLVQEGSQRARTLEAMVMLTSEPPPRQRAH